MSEGESPAGPRFSETLQRKKISLSEKYREQLFFLALAWYSAPPIAIAIASAVVVKRTFDVLLYCPAVFLLVLGCFFISRRGF